MLLLDSMVQNDFGNDLEYFQDFIFQYLLDRVHHGNSLGMRNALSSVTRKATTPRSGAQRVRKTTSISVLNKLKASSPKRSQ